MPVVTNDEDRRPRDTIKLHLYIQFKQSILLNLLSEIIYEQRRMSLYIYIDDIEKDGYFTRALERKKNKNLNLENESKMDLTSLVYCRTIFWKKMSKNF